MCIRSFEKAKPNSEMEENRKKYSTSFILQFLNLIHPEGRSLLFGAIFIIILINWTLYYFVGSPVLTLFAAVVSIVVFALTAIFFRYPKRRNPLADKEGIILSPCDGKLVVVEEVYEQEILERRCLKVSIFMSITDVHINWVAVKGKVRHVSHTEGNFLKAYLPKSSTENERSAVVIETPSGQYVLERQIAGAVARRISTYLKVGDEVSPNNQLGFIKFGSRVDLYLPLGTQIDVAIGDKVVGNTTVLGRLPDTPAPRPFTKIEMR